jgi:mono/diheme cytochrome c family protein
MRKLLGQDYLGRARSKRPDNPAYQFSEVHHQETTCHLLPLPLGERAGVRGELQFTQVSNFHELQFTPHPNPLPQGEREQVGGLSKPVWCAFLCLTLFLAGCSGSNVGYDPHLRYPLRDDVVFLSAPQDAPTAATPQGNLNATLAAYANHPGGKVVDPRDIPHQDREALRTELETLFGTPANPKLPGTSDSELVEGSKVYARHCASCHSLTGSGRGPGEWMHPFPRDFRAGLFKSATSHAKPSPTALKRIVRHGVPGTVMQAYDLLSDSELNHVVAYAIHLSVRGETERRLILKLEADEIEGTDIATESKLIAAKIQAEWQTAATAVEPNITLPTGEDAIRRGHELFASPTGASCISCHARYGHDDQYRYDGWGLAVKLPNLTRGEHRWGREPAELYQHIRYGIPAANMPANPQLTDAQLLDLTAFVYAMSRPAMLPDDVRKTLLSDPGDTTP